MFAALTVALTGPAYAAGQPSLTQWQGEYTDRSTVALTILPAGKFNMTTPCHGTGDALTMVTLKGNVSIDAGGWLQLTAKHQSLACKVSRRFDYYGVRNGGARLLVTHGELIMMVNALNSFGYFSSGMMPLQDVASAAIAPRAPDMSFEPRALMPPMYLAMLRAEPLIGAVTRVEPTGSEVINVAGWMMPPVMKERFSARVTVNRGSRQGVFAGMQLYGPQSELLIEHVRDEESEGTYRWIPPGAVIQTGTALSSRR